MAAVFRLGGVILLSVQRVLMRPSRAKRRVEPRTGPVTLRVPV